ncbi:MAG: hypothetical protein GAK38_02533 [Xylophilus sp.]|nr:MAG: hypothetical protein GAK38_02533 [Xylophilus sp.]
MLDRRLTPILQEELRHAPAVALLGPRQVGKTTLAHAIAPQGESLYLDLESERDRARLAEPELYLAQHLDRLVILDEVHRAPGLFPVLRGLIDQARRSGRRAGNYLLLGSASLDLLQQPGETLAGRIACLELAPLDVLETGTGTADALWLRGGFPDSFTAPDDARSLRWSENFIRTYLERDVPQFGPRIAAETLRRFWTMLAHHQGGLLNVAQLARNLGVDAKTAHGYIDLLCDLLLVRRLPPWHANTGKRLVKSPKVYIRDSGLVHALLGIGTHDALLSHPGGWRELGRFRRRNAAGLRAARRAGLLLPHLRRGRDRPAAGLARGRIVGGGGQAQPGAQGGTWLPCRLRRSRAGPPHRRLSRAGQLSAGARHYGHAIGGDRGRACRQPGSMPLQRSIQSCIRLVGPGVCEYLSMGRLRDNRRLSFLETAPSMPDASSRPALPDRLSIDPRSPHHVAAVFAHDVGIRFNGRERFDVEEYCVSEGWIKVPAGKTVDRKGRPLLIKLRGTVEVFYKG